MSDTPNGWNRYEKLVLDRLDEQRDLLRKVADNQSEQSTRIALLEESSRRRDWWIGSSVIAAMSAVAGVVVAYAKSIIG